MILRSPIMCGQRGLGGHELINVDDQILLFYVHFEFISGYDGFFVDLLGMIFLDDLGSDDLLLFDAVLIIYFAQLIL